MPVLHPIDPAVRITSSAAPLVHAPDVAARIDALWGEALETRPWLYDGALFDMVAAAPTHIEGRFVRYRDWWALRADETLRASYGVTPLAVTGVTRVAEGILLGRRSAQTTQDAGLWELVPAGSIDRGLEDGTVDPRPVLLAELHEELGIPEEAVDAIDTPQWLAEDEEPGVFDLVMGVTLRVAMGEVERLFGERPTDETAALRCVAHADVGALLGSESEALAPVSRAVLEHIAR